MDDQGGEKMIISDKRRMKNVGEEKKKGYNVVDRAAMISRSTEHSSEPILITD